MMLRALAAVWPLALAACVDATGQLHGGESRLEDATIPVYDAGPVANPCDDAGDRGDGSSFTDLYRDFFGPTGLASCSAHSICHVPNGLGAVRSNGYVCFPDQPTCWATMTNTIVPAGGTNMPETTTLYKALRKAPPTPVSGPMPFQSTFAFCPNDLARIKAWIVAGAAND
jgi:hypothetical protein